jgi:hypothetical protein
MSVELPDWIRGSVIVGRDAGGNLTAIRVDADGQLNVLLRGEDTGGVSRTVRVDDLGQLYAVLRGAGGVDVAVDASGRLSAILLGLYGSNYNPIAIDANGRIDVFMMDGADQWGHSLRIGNAELAARFNPLHAYDWRGNALFETDFSYGIPAGPVATTGAGASVELDPSYWLTGGYAMKLTGGSTFGCSASKYFRIPRSPAERAGFELTFSITPTCDWFGVFVDCNLETYSSNFGVGLKLTTGYITYLDDSNTWSNLMPVSFSCAASTFHKLKLVVDFDACKYTRLLYQNNEVDMSSYAGYRGVTYGHDYVDAAIGIVSRSGYNDVAYVDSFVVTNNEPAE